MSLYSLRQLSLHPCGYETHVCYTTPDRTTATSSYLVHLLWFELYPVQQHPARLSLKSPRASHRAQPGLWQCTYAA